MGTLGKPHVAEWYKKEFIHTMQAKGKLPKFVTEADEMKDKAYYETTERIFPGPGGQDTMLKLMMDKTEKRLNEAKNISSKVSFHSEASTEDGHGKTMGKPSYREERRARHKELKDKLASLEEQVTMERTARLKAEEDLLEIRSRRGTAAPNTPGA